MGGGGGGKGGVKARTIYLKITIVHFWLIIALLYKDVNYDQEILKKSLYQPFLLVFFLF